MSFILRASGPRWCDYTLNPILISNTMTSLINFSCTVLLHSIKAVSFFFERNLYFFPPLWSSQASAVCVAGCVREE